MGTLLETQLQEQYPSAWWNLNPDTFTLTADDFLKAHQSEDESNFSFISSYSKEIAELRESSGNEPNEYWGNVTALGQWIYLHLNELRRSGCLYRPCYDGESPYLQAIDSAIFTAIQEGNDIYILKFKGKRARISTTGWVSMSKCRSKSAIWEILRYERLRRINLDNIIATRNYY